MQFTEILRPEQIVPEIKGTTAFAAIDELIEHLVQTGKLAAELRVPISDLVKKRELSMTTGIGFGVAIPHAHSDLIENAVAVFGRSKTGINFSSLDGQPVKLVALLVVPVSQRQKYLHTLACIARFLQNAQTRRDIEAAPDTETIFAVIRTGQGLHDAVRLER